MSATIDRDVERLTRAQGLLGVNLFPVGIVDAIDADNVVACLEARFRRRRVLDNPSDHCRLIEHRRVLVMHHVNRGQQEDGQKNIHRRPGDGDQKTVPARMREKLRRITRALIHRIFAAHLHIAAQRDGADAVVGLAFPEAEQALAKANGKDLDPHSQPFGHGVVAKFVDQDHEAQNGDDGDQ